MKLIRSIAIVAAISIATFIISLPVVMTGCKTSQQQVVFNSLYTVEHATVTAYDGYVGLVLSGQLPTNDVPRVSKAFNVYQASFIVALDAAQFNTNSLAPASLIIESQDVINLITTIKSTKGTK
jgi:hypothetical protein